MPRGVEKKTGLKGWRTFMSVFLWIHIDVYSFCKLSEKWNGFPPGKFGKNVPVWFAGFGSSPISIQVILKTLMPTYWFDVITAISPHRLNVFSMSEKQTFDNGQFSQKRSKQFSRFILLDYYLRKFCEKQFIPLLNDQLHPLEDKLD